jgi:cyclopropane fatty-acyl-phospholipid synthase-like methyltransferase
MGIPERFSWAVETLAVKGGDSLLEIGCGRGVAVGLIALKLKTGHILAIDRSAAAVAAAKRNNEAWEAQGRVSFRQKAFAGLAEAEPFDKIFSINVNVFWTDPRAELPLLAELLKKDGRLYLFYEPPAATQRDKIARLIAEKFAGSGLAVTKVLRKDGGAALLCVIVMRASM